MGLPEEIQEAISTEATVKDIREAKGIIRETEVHYDDQMELCDIAQEEPQETDWMMELAREYFKDGKEAFQKLLDWERKDPDGSDIARELLVILNPTKFKMIRLEYANVMMTEHTIKVMPYRNHGENQEYDYMDFAKGFEKLFIQEYPEDLKMAAGDLYKRVYDESLYPEMETQEKIPEKKPEKKAPASVKTEAPKKSEVKKNRRKSRHRKSRKNRKNRFRDRPKSRRIFRNIVRITWKCRQRLRKRKKSKGLRHEKIIHGINPSAGSSRVYGEVMDKKMRSMRGVSFAALGKEEFWTELLEAEVDKNGEEIECVEQCAN